MAMSSTRICGPFMYDINANGDNYLDMLKRCILPLLDEQSCQNALSQQDSTPTQYAREFSKSPVPCEVGRSLTGLNTS